jgi:YVTN family beta-propeller protein
MDENIYKILKEKYENVVQFNLVNNTSSNLFVDLFNTSIINVPIQDSTTVIPPIGSPDSTFFEVTSTRYSVVNPNTGYIYIGDTLTNSVIVKDSNFNTIATIFIGIGTQPINSLVFCPTNNYIYVGDLSLSNVYVIDTATNTFFTTIFVTGATRSLLYVPSTNQVWVTTVNFGSPINVIDASTNTLLPIPLFPASQPQDLEYDSVNDLVFISGGSTNFIYTADAQTNTFLTQYATPQSNPRGIGIANNKLYVGYGVLTTSFDVFDITSLSFITNVNYGGLGAIIVQNNFLYISGFDLVYSYLSDGRIIVIDPNTDTIVNQLTGLISAPFTNVFFNPLDNSLWGQTNNNTWYNWESTIIQTPFYINGSANYNSFVNNLNNEPIEIQLIRLVTQSQNQLTNELQLTTIDSNGNQTFTPNFPINQVSAYQQQGNIGEIPFKNIVFDGRTYINQYQLNPNETTSFEIYYKQLDLTSASSNFPILFKPKIQLKEYIKKELNL